jgi:PEP-CTERM motif
MPPEGFELVMTFQLTVAGVQSIPRTVRFPLNIPACGFAIFLGLGSQLEAATATLHPTADATLFEALPDNNLGDSGSFMAGLRPKGGRSRALMLFNLPTGVPANATITAATLSLSVVRTPSGQANSSFELHKMLQSWGQEGNKSSSGGGAPASAGEVTWNSRSSSLTPWTTPGGLAGTDFASSSSAAQFVAGNGTYTFSSVNLLTDVQSWYANPSQNFGWMLLSAAEGTSRSIRRFGSHEDALNAPTLTIQYTVVPEPSTGIFLLSLGAFGGTLLWRRYRAGMLRP